MKMLLVTILIMVLNACSTTDNIIGSTIVDAAKSQQVTFSWKSGACKDLYRLYKITDMGWVKVAETTETNISMYVSDTKIQRWRVSGVCLSGVNKGEWWLNNGAWTSVNAKGDTLKK